MPIRVEPRKAERMVRQLYRDLFRRDPEPDVLRGLTAYFAEGRISVRIQLMRMLKSEEFFDKRLREATPEKIARELYGAILARPPESEDALKGAAGFIGNIGWRIQVDVMINSEEYLSRFGDDNLPTGAA
jgi:phycobilisome rod-core linker protein